MKRYWLMKSEPSSYSIDDLARDKTTEWSGVRNYQARNFMRDAMSVGDEVIFYHSSAEPPAAVGRMRVCSGPHPDSTAFDPQDSHFDPSSDPKNPSWICVDVEFVEKFARPVTLDEIKAAPELAGVMVAQRGSRLSVQPLSPEHFEAICRLGGA